ncbi:MAG: putative collagen-binding domain-containing protein, partial [Bacteroidota bacterium]
GYAIDAGNNTFVVYFKATEDPQLNLSSVDGEYVVEWFDPRNGGQLQRGDVTSVRAGTSVDIGPPPSDPRSDWVVVLRPT